LITLNLKKHELYNLFISIINRYIPKDCVRNGSPYHLFRLLLLYHDPELCAYLDTKKLTPDAYAHLWVKSLFAASSGLKVVLNLWDVYFQLGDQFLIFFLALVLVINAK
jgi:TBC1 domain family member 23